MPEPEEPKGERDLVNALNYTLWKVLTDTPEIKDGVEISFETPQRDWPPSATGEKPKLNLFLYDVRENPDMRREFTGQRPNAPFGGPGLPAGQRVGVNLSYMVTCWGGTPAEQHRILWAALEQLYAFSPLRNGTGENQNFVHQYLLSMTPIRTEVARADGAMRNISEFWSALGSQIRASINLVAMLDLELPAAAAEQPPQPREIMVDARPVLRYRGRLNIRKKNKGHWEILGEDTQVTLAGVGDTSQTGREISISRKGDGIFDAGHLAPARYRLSVQLKGLEAQHADFEVSARHPGNPADRMYAFGVDERGQFIDLPDGARGR